MSTISAAYPIGKFVAPEHIDTAMIQGYIASIEALPSQLQAATEGLSDAQLDTPYREDGWSLRQVVHHVADSHANAYIRTKWTLTEDYPTIKAYDENAWGNLSEAKHAPIDVSLTLIAALHARWVLALKSIQIPDFERQFRHPESQKDIKIKNMLALYVWHGKHHTAHITTLRNQMVW